LGLFLKLGVEFMQFDASGNGMLMRRVEPSLNLVCDVRSDGLVGPRHVGKVIEGLWVVGEVV
jgi:hypothetical protein